MSQAVVTVPFFTDVIQRLTKLIWKPKQYVDLTAAREFGRQYDIIVIGGGMLPFFFKNVIKSQNVSALIRNGWLCSYFSSFREPEY
jgi:hypothetical protein